MREVSAENEEAVISTGGGTACFKNNLAHMQENGTTVYIKMHPKSLAIRLNKARRLRPVVRDIQNKDMLTFVEEQLKEREEYYEQARIIVKGESLDLIELVKKIKQ